MSAASAQNKVKAERESELESERVSDDVSEQARASRSRAHTAKSYPLHRTPRSKLCGNASQSS
eukprot:238205-Rhodomonas_salina.1